MRLDSLHDDNARVGAYPAITQRLHEAVRSLRFVSRACRRDVPQWVALRQQTRRFRRLCRSRLVKTQQNAGRTAEEARLSQPSPSLSNNLPRSMGGVIGHSKALTHVFETLERIVDVFCPVLVTGEAGVGKSTMARALHRNGITASGPFVIVREDQGAHLADAHPVDPMEHAALDRSHENDTSDLAASDRSSPKAEHRTSGFLDRRDASFSALPPPEEVSTAHSGELVLDGFENPREWIEAAAGGTLYIEDLTTLPQHAQVELCDALQNEGEDKVEFRLVAASRMSPDELLASGRVREDFFYRASVVRAHVPPLRDRREDLDPLLRHLCAESSSHPAVELSPAARRLIDSYAFPGNVAELKAAITEAARTSSTGRIEPGDLPAPLRRVGTWDVPAVELPEDGLNLRNTLEAVENHLIQQALERTGWNKQRAATLLGLNRTTLVEMLKRKRMSRPAA